MKLLKISGAVLLVLVATISKWLFIISVLIVICYGLLSLIPEHKEKWFKKWD